MLETAAAHAMLNAITITHLSLHSVDAPAGGVNELTGGDYARVAKTLAAPASRKRLIASDAVFNLDTGHAPKSVGFWNGAEFIGYKILPVQPVIQVPDATYTVYANSTGLTI